MPGSVQALSVRPALGHNVIGLALIAITFSLLGLLALASVQYARVTNHPVSVALATHAQAQTIVTAGHTSTPLPGATPDNKALADQLRLLTGPWQAPLVAGPGWLHTLQRIEHHDDSAGTLPNGQVIPSSYLFDLGAPEPPSLDFNFVRDLNQANTWGTHVDRQEIGTADGRRLVVFEMRAAFAPLPVVTGDGTATSSVTNSITLDAVTGQVIATDQFTTLVNGVVQPTEHSEYVTVEHVSEAPAEILTP